MLSLAHGPTGAFITTIVPNPIVSLPLVLLSHFIEDRIPHWDVGQGLSSGKKSKKSAFFQELFFDFPLSIILVYLIFQINRPFNWIIWTGWFVGLLPDLIEFPYLFLRNRHPIIIKFASFHNYWHRSTPDLFWGTLPQILTLLIIVLLS